MVIRVSVIGYDLIGKRIADAVTRQHDMVVQGVFEDDPRRRALVVRKGFTPLGSNRDHVIAGGDLAVLCRDDCRVSGLPVVYAAHLRSSAGVLFSPCSSAGKLFSRPCIRIALPDVIALGRILKAITPLARVERLFVNTIVRTAHATQSSEGNIDALEPLPQDEVMNWQVAESFGKCVPRFQISQVRASYTHSHLHTVKLDLEHGINRQDVLAAFSDATRILLGVAADGFATTADIQEFFRNSMRSRGDRPELFVWEESIMVSGRQLFLMMDVCQEATSIPDTIDAIRLQQNRVSDVTETIRLTDESLDLGHSWQSAIEICAAGSET